VYELLWVPEILSGKTVAEVGDKYEGDVLGEDIINAWNDAAHKASIAVETADLTATAHLSYGDFPNKKYIVEVANDVLIHGWDVGQSINCSVVFDEDVANTLYEAFLPRKDELAKSGVFNQAVDVSENASVQVKLLALLGRKQAD
jgi:uncharacterized protein (TIGR03086 family)